MDQVFAAGRASAVDHTKIAKESIKGRGLERRAAMKAEADVAIAGLNAKANINMAKSKADAFEDLGKKRGKQARMAGVLGGLGALAGGYVYKKGADADRAAADKRDQEMADHIASIKSTFESNAEALNNRPPYPEAPTYQAPKLLPYPDESGGNSSGGNSGQSMSLASTPGWGKWSKVIRYGEGTSGDKGYTTQFTGTQFTDTSKHPRQIRTSGDLSSDAAGAYQFLSTTWDRAKNALNLKDFSPASQEQAGRWLTQQRGVDPDAVIENYDDFVGALDKLAPEWASIPYSKRSPKGYGMGSSYYGQGGYSAPELWKIYNSN